MWLWIFGAIATFLAVISSSVTYTREG
jgi:hypothetical protein